MRTCSRSRPRFSEEHGEYAKLLAPDILVIAGTFVPNLIDPSHSKCRSTRCESNRATNG